MAASILQLPSKSGTIYPFEVYEKGVDFTRKDGVYIFARFAPDKNLWFAIYIGEGDIKVRTEDEKHLKCAESKGFTHFLIMLEDDEERRKFIEEDLLGYHTEALEENGGCNKTKTG